MSLPTDAAQRKATPVCTGFVDYFPQAMAVVAQLSKIGNDQHNPGQPLHWAKGRSNDHADCIMRHLIERGTLDVDGVRHSAKVAWRAMALLQIELEAAAKVEKPQSMTDQIAAHEDSFAAATRKRMEHNADPTTRHGGQPKLESKFGFTIGETVNYYQASVGCNPGVVSGFTAHNVMVRWQNSDKQEFPYAEHELRHGA